MDIIKNKPNINLSLGSPDSFLLALKPRLSLEIVLTFLIGNICSPPRFGLSSLPKAIRGSRHGVTVGVWRGCRVCIIYLISKTIYYYPHNIYNLNIICKKGIPPL